MNTLVVRSGAPLEGNLTVPGDKSISHRAVILGAIAGGVTTIAGFLPAADCLSTARALQQMNVPIEGLGSTRLVVHGRGLRGLCPPPAPLDLGNSGTGMRLLLGVLAGQNFSATLVGDASLSRRPMDRVAHPLGLMGIQVRGQGERCTPPVTITGGRPQPITYRLPIASAQVKSAVLLAGLYAEGVTTVIEPALSRDHTERMLQAFGARLQREGLRVSVQGNPHLAGRHLTVPADFSSAAFFIVAALLVPQSRLTVRGVLLNPTRAALLEVLARMGADVQVSGHRTVGGEPVGDITASYGSLRGTTVGGDEIPRLLDEIPILAVAATQARGTTTIKDAAELRVKESDRLAVMARALRAMGGEVEELPDGLVIHGPTALHGAELDSHNDHRVAMSIAVAGLLAAGRTTIRGAGCIDTSFPGFADKLQALGADIDYR